MNQRQAADVIAQAFSWAGFAVPTTFSPDAIVKELLPYDYEDAVAWITYTIDKGGDPREFARLLANLRRSVGRITMTDDEQKRRELMDLWKERQANWEELWQTASSGVRSILDHRIAEYRYVVRKPPYYGSNIPFVNEMLHYLMRAVGSGSIDKMRDARKNILRILDVPKDEAERLMAYAEIPLGSLPSVPMPPEVRERFAAIAEKTKR